MVLLIASALPLLADDEVAPLPSRSVTPQENHHDYPVIRDGEPEEGMKSGIESVSSLPAQVRIRRSQSEAIQESDYSEGNLERIIVQDERLRFPLIDLSPMWCGLAADSSLFAISNKSVLIFYPFENGHFPFVDASRQPRENLCGNGTLSCILPKNASFNSVMEKLKGRDVDALERHRTTTHDLNGVTDFTNLTVESNIAVGDDSFHSSGDSSQALDEEVFVSLIIDETETDNALNGANSSSPDPAKSSSENSEGKEAYRATVVKISAETVPLCDENAGSVKHVAVDYASKSVGALILDSSPNFQGASNLLQKDRDKYAIVPCEEPSKYVVIGLSEDILVKQIVIANYERYSSHLKEIRLSGSASTAMGREHWVDLGTYLTTAGGSGTQIFGLTEPTWARYLKFEFLSHYGDEFYCTVSQISVHGSTVLQGFHEQWGEDESTEHDDDLTANEAADDPTTSPLEVAAAAEESEKISDLESDQPTSADGGELKVESMGKKGERADIIAVSNARSARPLGNSPALDYPALQLRAVCLDDWNFEHKMLLFSSSNVTSFDSMGALSSASICLTSSQPATSNKSASQLLPNGLAVGGLIVRRSNGSELRLIANASKGREKVSILADVLTETSPIVERIKNLVHTTSGVVNLEGIGSRLRRSPPAVFESVVEMDLLPSTKTSDVSSKGDKETDIVSVGGSATNSYNKEESTANPKSTANSGSAVKPPTGAPTFRVQPRSRQKTIETAQTRDEMPVSDDIHATGLALAKGLQRLPSAKCLETLNFSEFKTSVLKSRSGSGVAGSGPPGGTMEPIFKKLSDEIKSLQANVGVHDQFAKASISCYQRVMLELVLEMETLRLSHDARISKIEDDLKLGAWVVTLHRVITSLFVGMWSSLRVWYSIVLLLARRAEVDSNVMIYMYSLGGMFYVMVVCCLFLLIDRFRHQRSGCTTRSSPKTRASTDPRETLENPLTCRAKEIEKTSSADSTDKSDTKPCSKSTQVVSDVLEKQSHLIVSPE